MSKPLVASRRHSFTTLNVNYQSNNPELVYAGASRTSHLIDHSLSPNHNIRASLVNEKEFSGHATATRRASITCVVNHQQVHPVTTYPTYGGAMRRRNSFTAANDIPSSVHNNPLYVNTKAEHRHAVRRQSISGGACDLSSRNQVSVSRVVPLISHAGETSRATVQPWVHSHEPWKRHTKDEGIGNMKLVLKHHGVKTRRRGSLTHKVKKAFGFDQVAKSRPFEADDVSVLGMEGY